MKDSTCREGGPPFAGFAQREGLPDYKPPGILTLDLAVIPRPYCLASPMVRYATSATIILTSPVLSRSSQRSITEAIAAPINKPLAE